MQAGISTSGEASISSQNVSLKGMLFNIIPKNLVDPFKGGNILQVMFLTIFFGVIVNQMGEKAKGVTDCVDFAFRFAIAVLKIIVKAIPFVVFLSMVSLLASTGIDSLITFSSLFGGLFVGVILVWLVGALAIAIFGRISPVSMTKKNCGFKPVGIFYFQFSCETSICIKILCRQAGNRFKTCRVFNSRRSTAQ